MTITLNDIAKAAADEGVTVMQACNMMQAACAKLGDEATLDALCTIKAEIIGL